MASQYPAQVDVMPTWVNGTSGRDKRPETTISAEDMQAISDAIVKIQQVLGANPQGADSTVAQRVAALATAAEAAQTAASELAASLPASVASTVSPALTGEPTAPTAPSGTATTQLATTQFVAQALGEIDGGTP